MIPFGRIGPMRPEQVPRLFRIYTSATETTDRGRERAVDEKKLKWEGNCIMAEAKPEERERFNQIGKVVSHSILQRGSPVATENDTIVLVKNGKERRSFRVQAVHNKGELDIDTVYYCEERSDLP